MSMARDITTTSTTNAVESHSRLTPFRRVDGLH